VPNAAGDLLTPSVVLFDEGGTVVGKEALLASALEPEKVAECVKRDMGAKVYRKKINGQFLPPEVISSLILRSLKADAERRLGPIRRAIVTVPAYFDETRRRATVDAGRMAGASGRGPRSSSTTSARASRSR
jgi:molecular chaperone DnaK